MNHTQAIYINSNIVSLWINMHSFIIVIGKAQLHSAFHRNGCYYSFCAIKGWNSIIFIWNTVYWCFWDTTHHYFDKMIHVKWIESKILSHLSKIRQAYTSSFFKHLLTHLGHKFFLILIVSLITKENSKETEEIRKYQTKISKK